MAANLNHELFRPQRRVAPYLKPLLVVAAVGVLAAVVTANWSSVYQALRSPESLYQEAYDAGRLDEALAAARAMVEADPSSAEALRAVAAVYIQMAINGQDPQASIAAATAAAGEAQRLDRAAPETRRILGFILELKGDLKGAEREYLAALDEDPLNASALAQLAWVYERQRRDDTARTLYQKAIAADPENEQSRVFYARFLYVSGDYEAAIAQAQGAAESERVDFAAEANRVLSASYLAEGKLDEARPPAERALELAPDSPSAMVNYGELLLAELFGPKRLPFDETLSQVRDLADRAAVLDPTLALPPFLGFKAAYSQGDRIAAEEYSSRALDLLPNDQTLSPESREAIRVFVRTVPSVQLAPKK